MNRLIASVALTTVLAVSACGGSSGAGGSGTTAAGTSSVSSAPGGGQHDAATITIKDFGYSGDLMVKAGEQVTVTNQDSVAHTLTGDQGGQFDTGNIDAGGSGTFTAPSKPGTYPFGCTYHPEMSGELTVT